MAAVTSTFSVNIGGVPSFPDNEDVGIVYEVGLNGEGYMLADIPGGELAYRRATVPLEPQQRPEPDQPFSDSVDRYTFVGLNDWSGGAGQRLLDRERSDPTRFWKSEGIDPFTNPGQISVLPQSAQTIATTAGKAMAVIAGGRLYVRKSATQVGYKSDRAGAEGGPVTHASMTAIEDMASDGSRWYAATGADIIRGTTTAAVWSTINAEYLGFAVGRICCSYQSGAGSTPNVWTTLDDNGTEEVANGRLVLDDDWTVGKTVGGSGFAWFPANSANFGQGVVYRWEPGSDQDPPAVAWDGVAGHEIMSLFLYQDLLYIKTKVGDATNGASKFYVWRAAINQFGALVPQVVLTYDDDDGTADDDWGWAARGDKVFFGWSSMRDGIAGCGIGAIDTVTGGWAKWVYAPGNKVGGVYSVVVWDDDIVFTATDGAYIVDLDELPAIASSGWLITSISDKRSGLEKIYDQLLVLFEETAASDEILVEASLDGGLTWSTVVDITQVDLSSKQVDFGWKAQSIAFRVTITVGDEDANDPKVELLQMRFHPVGLADQVITLPISCADDVTDLNGRPLYGAPGSGAALSRRLEGLVQSRVNFQDIDYQETRSSSVWDVEQVEVRSIHLMDAARGKLASSLVSLVTLRRLEQ